MAFGPKQAKAGAPVAKMFRRMGMCEQNFCQSCARAWAS